MLLLKPWLTKLSIQEEDTLFFLTIIGCFESKNAAFFSLEREKKAIIVCLFFSFSVLALHLLRNKKKEVYYDKCNCKKTKW